MLIFKVLHILSMFTAVTFLMGDALFLAVAFWRRDVRALAAFQRIVGYRQTVIGASIFLLGIVFGLLTAATGGIDFFRGWLIAAYVLVVAVFAINGSPFVQRMPKVAREALEADAGRGSPEEVARRMSSTRTGLIVAIALNAAPLRSADRGHRREAVLTSRLWDRRSHVLALRIGAAPSACDGIPSVDLQCDCGRLLGPWRDI